MIIRFFDLVNTGSVFHSLCWLIRTCFILMLQNWLSSVVKVRTRDGLGFFNLSIGEGYTKIHKQDDG